MGEEGPLATHEFCFDEVDGQHRVVLPSSMCVLRRPLVMTRSMRVGSHSVHVGSRVERQYVFVLGVEHNSPRSIREAQLAASQLLPSAVLVSSLPLHSSSAFVISHGPSFAERVAREVVREYVGDAVAAASGQYCGRELDAVCSAAGIVGCSLGFGTRPHLATVADLVGRFSLLDWVRQGPRLLLAAVRALLRPLRTREPLADVVSPHEHGAALAKARALSPAARAAVLEDCSKILMASIAERPDKVVLVLAGAAQVDYIQKCWLRAYPGDNKSLPLAVSSAVLRSQLGAVPTVSMSHLLRKVRKLAIFASVVALFGVYALLRASPAPRRPIAHIPRRKFQHHGP